MKFKRIVDAVLKEFSETWQPNNFVFFLVERVSLNSVDWPRTHSEALLV